MQSVFIKKRRPAQCEAFLMQGSVPTSADQLSASITRKVRGSRFRCLALFCFNGPLRKGVNASGIRLIAVAGAGPRWVIWHGVGLNRIVALKA